ncbi:MAG: lamin tail domain-containing protein [Nanoarchaeota archaeon]|nr:lamin tail domain-containing protein [Nanoarchaeota archaeon]
MHASTENSRNNRNHNLYLLTAASIFLLIFLATDSSALQITEIMFNPDGSDSGREWIEIYNNNSKEINLSGMTFYESETNHKTESINAKYILYPKQYAIIVDKLQLFLEDYPWLEQYNTTESNITLFDSSFSLVNTGEYIALKINNTELTSLNYTTVLQNTSIDEGFSLCFKNLTWEKSNCPGGSPGLADCLNQSANLSNSTTNNQTDENITEEDFISGNATNNNICDITLNIETEKTILENKEKIKFKHRLTNAIDTKKYNYTIKYWIEDIFNTTIKEKRNTTNANKKQWTPSIKAKLSVAFLRAVVYPECNDTNLSNNYAEMMLIIKHPEYEEEVEECDCKEESSSTEESSTPAKQRKPDIEYSLHNLPKSITQNSTLSFNATIINNDDKEHEIILYSYAYRGNKCISGDGNRTLNTIGFMIKPENSRTIELNNTINDPKPGEYKIKLVVNKDRQKTNKQLVRQINVTAYIPQEDDTLKNHNESAACNCSVQQIQLNNAPLFYDNQDISAIIIEPENKPNLIYKSKDQTIKDNIIYFILAFMATCIIIMALTKKHI